MKDLLRTVYDAMDERLADDIVVLDFRKQSAFVDYFVIASSKNQRMANSIIDNVIDKASINGFDVKHNYNDPNSKWLLLDLGEVVCHVFIDDERSLYNLEGLWKDLPIVKM